jgi:hypothetical protein
MPGCRLNQSATNFALVAAERVNFVPNWWPRPQKEAVGRWLSGTGALEREEWGSHVEEDLDR